MSAAELIVNPDESENEDGESLLDPTSLGISSDRAWEGADGDTKDDAAKVYGWDRLPDPVAWRIFSLLPPGELFAAARVCRGWRKCARDARLWPTMVVVQQVEPTTINEYCSTAFRCADTITDATLIFRSTLAAQPSNQARPEKDHTGLSFDDVKNSKDQGLQNGDSSDGAKAPGDHVTMTFKNWTTVDVEMQGGDQIHAAALAPMATSCTNLRTLSISNLRAEWLDALDHFATCKHLESLTISGSHTLSGYDLCMSIAANLGAHDHLRYLNITSPPVGDEGLRILASSFTKQKTLVKTPANKNMQGTRESAEEEGSNTGLISLSFSPVSMTGQKFLNLERFYGLRSLCLHYPPLAVIGAYRVAMKQLNQLVVLRLLLADQATPWVLDVITEEFLPKLKHLHVTAPIFGDYFSEAIAVPGLRHLGIESSSDGRDEFTDTGLLRLMARCNGLHSLYLGDMHSVSDDSLVVWLKRGLMPKLKWVYLHGSTRVTEIGLETLELVRPDLKVVMENANEGVRFLPNPQNQKLQTYMMHEAWFCPSLGKVTKLAALADKIAAFEQEEKQMMAELSAAPTRRIIRSQQQRSTQQQKPPAAKTRKASSNASSAHARQKSQASGGTASRSAQQQSKNNTSKTVN